MNKPKTSGIKEREPFCSLVQRWRNEREQRHQDRLAALEAQLQEQQPDADGHVQMPLSRMRPGDQGHVISLCAECAARYHLLELGFTAGIMVEVIRIAPFGDPITVRIRGCQLSLRGQEAEAITMRRCPPQGDFAALSARGA